MRAQTKAGKSLSGWSTDIAAAVLEIEQEMRELVVDTISRRIDEEAIEDGTNKILPSRILYILTTERKGS